jgi:hypothetical protein
VLDVQPNEEDGSSYRVAPASVRLELCAGKLACTVLRGLGTGNRPRLLGIIMNIGQLKATVNNSQELSVVP